MSHKVKELIHCWSLKCFCLIEGLEISQSTFFSSLEKTFPSSCLRHWGSRSPATHLCQSPNLLFLGERHALKHEELPSQVYCPRKHRLMNCCDTFDWAVHYKYHKMTNLKWEINKKLKLIQTWGSNMYKTQRQFESVSAAGLRPHTDNSLHHDWQDAHPHTYFNYN